MWKILSTYVENTFYICGNVIGSAIGHKKGGTVIAPPMIMVVCCVELLMACYADIAEGDTVPHAGAVLTIEGEDDFAVGGFDVLYSEVVAMVVSAHAVGDG